MNNSKNMLIASLVFGLVTVIGLYQYIESIKIEQEGSVYVRLKDEVSISRGDTVSRSDLIEVTLPKGQGFESLEQVAIKRTKGVGAWLDGRPVNQDVPKGSFLLYAFFSQTPDSGLSGQIDAKNRALTIPVNQTSAVGYFVEPESRVDILTTYTEYQPSGVSMSGTGKPTRGRVVTKTIQQNVRVLAVGEVSSRAGYLGREGGYSTVTVEVTPVDAEKLVFAMTQTNSGFILLLRNPANDRIEVIPSVSWENLN